MLSQSGIPRINPIWSWCIILFILYKTYKCEPLKSAFTKMEELESEYFHYKHIYQFLKKIQSKEP